MKIHKVLILIVFFITGCGVVAKIATIEKVPYEYFGEIKFSEPRHLNKRTLIPFSISGGDNRYDSAIIIGKIKAKENGREIDVTLYKSVAGGETLDLVLVLKKLKQGNYNVYYLNPDGSKYFIQAIDVK
jgi:hypothetical protein